MSKPVRIEAEDRLREFAASCGITLVNVKRLDGLPFCISEVDGLYLAEKLMEMETRIENLEMPVR